MMFIIVVLMIFWFSLINYFVYVKKIIEYFCYVFFICLNIILVCYGYNKYFVECVLECKIGL